MTRKNLCRSVLLVGAAMMGGTVAVAQNVKAFGRSGVSGDVAVTYVLERAKLQPSNCGCFWLNGSGIDAGVTLYKGFGIAGNLTGVVANSNLPTGEGLDKISYMAGPRYTYRWKKWRPAQVFGEALFGGVHAFNSVFPRTGSASTSASAFSMQTDVGVDISFYKRFSVRAFDVGYVYTQLPNNGSNSQNDLRLAAGLSYHFGR